jgi:hypothetical protein
VPTAQIDPGGRGLHLLDDVFGRAGIVGRLDNRPGHLGVDDDGERRMLLDECFRSGEP